MPGRQRRIVARATGRVQGVGYRAFAADEAVRLLITGNARNFDDGFTVEVIAEGDEPTLRSYIERNRDNPDPDVRKLVRWALAQIGP